MKSIEEFKESLTGIDIPRNLSSSLKALWYDGKGEWDLAHDEVDAGRTKDECWVHAYLHRKEGDLGNAQYWYSRAKKELFQGSLEEEWFFIVNELLKC